MVPALTAALARSARRCLLGGAGAAAAMALVACGSPAASTASTSAASTASTSAASPTASTASPAAAGATGTVALPAPRARFDYQLGGAYQPPAGVRAVSRDRAAQPVAGLYNICYVNGFQAQPDALDWWRQNHADLLLHDGHGSVVMDTEWHEALLDVSTDAKRAALAEIVGGWIDGCAKSGFQAVEPDNFESYSRSGGKLAMADDVAFARLLARRAHADGLAIAQKNGAEMLDQHQSIGFDFAVAEQCGEYDECGEYAAAYADRVFVVEYAKDKFDRTCRAWGDKLSVVLRDHGVTPAGDPAYVYRAC